MDSLTPQQRSKRMSRVRGKDTRPEMSIRKLVHGMGYRYRLHRKDLPGSPDLVFPSRSKVIFVHGCFWHRHPDPDCKLARMPKSKLEFWEPKLSKNRVRDVGNEEKLRNMGWECLVIWECEIRNTASLREKIVAFLQT
ncbi:very short patch repair endonuclease [Jiella mangrovi]|uniref:Very short patch repair endonuclease n=1 Tax=Jiella mangrovi TaxID=2821407 RepID=A0ABS4BBW0_9HYPH|nr:DNA mismatch endonuclease Vsr [Jiella mangrovi]MBP0614248.1 DNA mismatch endonuclease Vsr [Jiella mangrovi]